MKKLGDRNGSYVFSQTKNLSSVWLGATPTEQDEKWTTGQKCFDMEEYFARRESEILSQPHKVMRIF